MRLRLGITLALLALGLVASAGAACRSEAESLTLEQAVGQMLLVGFRGLGLDGETRALLRDLQPGGVILFDRDGPSSGELPRNIESPDQLRALTAALQRAADIPLLIAIDAEGGYVNRLKEKYGFTVSVPTALTLGAGPVGETATVAADLAAEMVDLGLNWNLAPVVDVNIDPESPAIGRWERSFSDDPAQGRRPRPRIRPIAERRRHRPHAQALPRPRQRDGRYPPRRHRHHRHLAARSRARALPRTV